MLFFSLKEAATSELRVLAAGLLAVALLGSCTKQESGYNMLGEMETCTPLDEDVACTLEVTPDDEFGARCAAAGFRTVLCECHHWLCEVPPNELPELEADVAPSEERPPWITRVP